jgi:hypothetical protein
MLHPSCRWLIVISRAIGILMHLATANRLPGSAVKIAGFPRRGSATSTEPIVERILSPTRSRVNQALGDGIVMAVPAASHIWPGK